MREQAYFDKGAAQRAVRFIEGLKHTKGRWAGVPFKLARWQREGIIEPLFGMKRKDGTRLRRVAYLSLPRKNGKTAIGSAIALYMLFADGEVGADVYSAACDREQASLVFTMAKGMVEGSRLLSRRSKIIDSTKRIVVRSTGSVYRALSAEAPTKWGFSPSCLVLDELHAWPSRDLYDALTTAGGARAQPLTVIVTTAGWETASIWREVYDYARRVRDGTIEDPNWFVYIREPEEGTDWQSRKVWRACNPAIGSGFRDMAELTALAREAAHVPAKQNVFRRLYLNDPNTRAAERWIDLSLWDEQAGPMLTDDALAGRTCYAGLDLGSVSDLTAWLLVFPHEEDQERIDVLARFWCPEARLRDPANRHRSQYQAWARQGWLTPTPGEAIDYGFVKAAILEDASKFRLVDLAIDRLFQAHQLSMELIEEGLQVAGMGQGFLSMAVPMKEFQRRLLARKIHHGGNDCLRWQIDGVVVRQDPAGNLKIDKANSQTRVDGPVALVMALDRAIRHEEKASVYETHGVRHV